MNHVLKMNLKLIILFHGDALLYINVLPLQVYLVHIDFKKMLSKLLFRHQTSNHFFNPQNILSKI